MKSILIVSFLFLCSCVTPDTQPFIEGLVEWRDLEDKEHEKHMIMVQNATFSDNELENQQMRNDYMNILRDHRIYTNNIANMLISGLQRIGQFDENYANKTLDQMIELYKKFHGLNNSRN